MKTRNKAIIGFLLLASVVSVPIYGNPIFRIYIGGLTASTASSPSNPCVGTPDPSVTWINLFNGNGTGAYGPTVGSNGANYGASYNITNGVQHWTVPVTGNYTLEATGAAGGNSVNGNAGGKGAEFRITMNLTAGTVLDMVVGQKGGYYSSGGGGGASVISSCGVPILVAGGGGGAWNHGGGGQGSNALGGAGVGGTVAEAGAGYYGDAPPNPSGGQALSYVDGATGSTGGNPSYAPLQGGFGGGGGAETNTAGGGGGYNGGNPGVGGTSYVSPNATIVSSFSGSSNYTTYGSITVGLN